MLAASSVMAAWLATRIGLESGLAPGVMDWITHRPELATPVTGWKQLKEGVYLFQGGLDPYDSGVFHQSPLLLHLFSFIHSPILVALVYGLVDCYSAWILLRLFRSKWPRNTGPVNSVKLKDDQWMLSPAYQIHDWHLILFYLFSPLNVLTSLSKSTVVFNNLAVLLALDGALQNRMAFSMFSLSIGTHLSVYPVLLVPSCIGIILDRRGSASIASTITKSLGFYVGHFLSLGLFTPFSVLFTQLDVNKYLRPNVGLHWYFSIEMFDHFRLFFNVVFQIHLLIYILPMMIKFKNEKVFGFLVMTGIISTFKSYPSIGDTSFSNTLLLLLYPELISYLRHPLLTISLYFYGLCLLPAFHHLWMNLGSGNANFYYASTLVWAVANGLFWIDAISAILKRNFQIVDLDAKEIDKSNEVIIQT
ncbi:hypothetical protein KEM48_013171 [Puccinia striiformis f. sp. tritici PST-130]|uniref:GPI transamidase subunit PIG-U n=2 Tax=Puccinia striiformis f. sp. tritici PST-78 TaxID=1165861 RepID=A0A0L0V3H3_9BASI|nr:hypothetical protein Pst134EB_012932 [Puccinia striiformis f. sp. tritici]KAI9631242.1 hypothetical protein KEM48_013171 [Puccinia striiformis f. sp. tritici PST-130]KNE93865.1 hypothetical protein PSTG_12778 [Puccinia striiformis f. sp. tritici PST-78]